MEKKGFISNGGKDIDVGVKYFSIISIINNLKLNNRQIELLAFVNIKGTISPKTFRDEFVTLFKSSTNTLNNLISQLQRKKLLVKDDNGKIRINNSLKVSLTTGIILLIKINNNDTR